MHIPMKRALQIILGVGLFGLAFSGVLSYRELFAAEPQEVCTPVGAAGTIFGYPPCIYGLGMYLIIVVVAALGLYGRRGENEAREHAVSTAT